VTVGQLKAILAQDSAGDDTVIMVDQGWLANVDKDNTTPWLSVNHANVNVETPGDSFVVLS
jgi:hypothetical protein